MEIENELQSARKIWDNGKVAVILRRGGSNPIRLRIPYDHKNRALLKGKPKNREPVWNQRQKFWELPKSRFDEVVEAILNRFGSVYIIQPYREQEVCSPSCMVAIGFECQCSCLGENHGKGNHQSWYEITEALAVRFGDIKFGCRLLQRTQGALVSSDSQEACTEH